MQLWPTGKFPSSIGVCLLQSFSLTLPTLSLHLCLGFPPCPILHWHRPKAVSLLTNGNKTIYSIQRGNPISMSDYLHWAGIWACLCGTDIIKLFVVMTQSPLGVKFTWFESLTMYE